MKKICGILCMMAILFCVSTQIFAKTGPSLTIANVTASPGKDIEVPIEISNNTGICGAKITLNYDENLTLTSIATGSALSDLIFTKSGDLNANPITFLWDGMEADKSNGTMLVLTFNAPDVEGVYPISAFYEEGDVIDGDIVPVKLEIINGAVNVNDEEIIIPEVPEGSTSPDDDSKDIPKETYTVTAGSSMPGNSPKQAIDGNGYSFWEAEWGIGNINPEVMWYQIELEEVTVVDAVRYLPRWEGATGNNDGFITQYLIQVSVKGENWTTVAEGIWEQSEGWKIAEFDAVQAKYVRLTGVSTWAEVGENSDMSIAEIRVTVAEDVVLKSALKAAIQEANNLVASDYKNMEAVYSALEIAEAVVKNNNATQKEVDEATAYLVAEIKALERVAEKSALRAAIADAKKVDLNLYTTTTARALAEAITTGETLIETKDATQEAVDAATAAIVSAKEALVKKIVDEESKPPVANSAFDQNILAKNAIANSEMNPSNGSDGPASWAFDDENHWWHSRWGNWEQMQPYETVTKSMTGKPSSTNPIWIQTGFDQVYYIDRIEYVSREKGFGIFKDYTVSVANLADPTATPTDDDFEIVKSGTLAGNTETQTIQLSELVAATHVRITVTSVTCAGDGYVAAKKINIYGQDEILAEEEEKVVRLFGDTRYDTSLKNAEALKAEMAVESFENVIITYGQNFPDALSGSCLAAEINAPIIIINKKHENEIVEYVKNNLTANGTVYILGDTGVVPESVEIGLNEYEVIRLGGLTRYETNLEILNEAGIAGKDLLVCTGRNYADSLSAAATGLPILIVKE